MRLLEEVGLEVELAELVGAAAVVAGHAVLPWVGGGAGSYSVAARPAPSLAQAAGRTAPSVTRSTSAIGSWRKRLPISANAAGSPVVRKR